MWKYKQKVITDLSQIPKGAHGFVYHIVHKPTGRKYIGKKILYNTRKKKMTKKQLAEWDKPGRKPKYDIIITESNWKQYIGSNEEFKQFLKKGSLEDFERNILIFCFTKKQLTFYETKYQFQYNVLEDKQYVNSNILGKFYASDLII